MTYTSDIESVMVKDPKEIFTVTNSNLLHYIVPKHKDFDLEVTDNEVVVQYIYQAVAVMLSY
jgi:hypothetical protein